MAYPIPETNATGDTGRNPAVHELLSGECAEAQLCALVARMAAGDEGAMAELYDRTVAKLNGFARRWRVPESLVDEALMDAYFQAWNEAARYEPGRAKVTTWLTMMFRSRLLDTLRRSDVAESCADLTETVEAEDTVASALDILQFVEEASAVHRELEALSPVQRQLVSLAFFCGLSHQEIAAHVAMPLGTVKAHIRRALTRMRASLEPAYSH